MADTVRERMRKWWHRRGGRTPNYNELMQERDLQGARRLREEARKLPISETYNTMRSEQDEQGARNLRREARRLEWSAFGNRVNDFVGNARSRFKFSGNIIAIVVLFVLLALLIFNNFIFAGIAAALGIVYVS